MAKPVEIRVNPAVLTWARETIGYSIEEASRKAGVGPEKLRAWELGRAYPSYVQLETLAYTVYRRPLAVLFRDEPPVESPAGQEFRNLPKPAANQLSTEMRLAIRKAKHFQTLMNELGDEGSPQFALFSLTLQEKPAQAATRFRDFVDLSVEEQKRWPADEAFARFWEFVERLGIFVLLMDLPLEEARAFSLSDARSPLFVFSKQ
ncbi:MAG: hypothetical protein H7Y12_12315, partial [Sphingobacteriaceae bacterium]|nr:hypothetical protein [Cytophagaceae bacterium]